VQSTVDEARRCRTYRCACQSRDEYGYHLLGADQGDLHEFVTAWHCDGHPRLQLPTELDGVAIPAVGPFASIVGQALAAPPFTAPGFRTQAFWVLRLFRLLVDQPQQPIVSQAVAAQLSSADPPVAAAAMDFFYEVPFAPGAEQIAAVADRDRDRLRATPDPASTAGGSLHVRLLETLGPQLAAVPGGAPVDPLALDLAHRALVAGEAGTTMLYHVAVTDPRWFCDHAADIARANPDELEHVLEALKDCPAAERAVAVRAVAALSKAADKAVRAWLKDNPALDPSRTPG
jgi:hypothetical protein